MSGLTAATRKTVEAELELGNHRHDVADMLRALLELDNAVKLLDEELRAMRKIVVELLGTSLR